MQAPLKFNTETYETLLAIAHNALLTANALRKEAERPWEEAENAIALLPNQLDVIILDYAIAALEAYVNYLGFIFINEWPSLQKKNFWIQYEYLAKALYKLSIELPEEPMHQYRLLRDKRNHLHHLQALETSVKGEKIISADEAKAGVEGVERFMTRVQKQLKDVTLRYGSLKAMLRAINDDLQLTERETCLKRFIT